MKKILFSFLLLLIGCQSTPPSMPGNTFVPQMEGFDFSQSCPHVCWEGINPDTTSADEAKAILQSSNQIDRQWYTADANGIVTPWHPKTFNTIYNVSIVFENGLVKSINITNVVYTVNDFVRILGQPDLIRIKVQRAIVDFMMYDIYFSSRRMMIEVDPAKWTGPDPGDSDLTVLLNVEPDLPDPLVDWGNNQPWLGYGHIKDYYPNLTPEVFDTPGPNEAP